eukprot:gene2027-3102_t
MTSSVVEMYPNGDKYEGQVGVDGTKHGWGKYTFANGKVYEGNWASGKMNGWGEFVESDTKDRFVGDAAFWDLAVIISLAITTRVEGYHAETSEGTIWIKTTEAAEDAEIFDLTQGRPPLKRSGQSLTSVAARGPFLSAKMTLK